MSLVLQGSGCLTACSGLAEHDCVDYARGAALYNGAAAAHKVLAVAVTAPCGLAGVWVLLVLTTDCLCSGGEGRVGLIFWEFGRDGDRGRSRRAGPGVLGMNSGSGCSDRLQRRSDFLGMVMQSRPGSLGWVDTVSW